MANLFPPESSTFEVAGSTGKWNAWYGCSVEQSTEQAHGGSGSLKITPTGSSVGLMTGWPGISVPVSAGDYEVTAWAMGPTSSGTLTGSWKDSGAGDVGTFSIAVQSGASWQPATTKVTAPAGAVSMYFNTDISSFATDTVYLDDLTLTEKVAMTTPVVTADIPLRLALSAATAAQHRAVADIPLALATTATTAARHAVTADIPLDLALSPTTNAPSVAGATVTAEIPLGLALAATAAAAHRATTEIPLGLKVTATAGQPVAARDITILKVGAPATAWATGKLATTWATTIPAAKWRSSTPVKRWAATAPTRQDPS